MKSLVAACFLSIALVELGEAATLSISWDGGPSVHPASNRMRAEGAVATVVVTAVGFDRPVLGVIVRIRVGSTLNGMPDSWRFDPDGCADGGFQTPEVAIDPSCPFLTGANPQRISVAEYWSYEGDEAFAFYFAHDPVAVSATERYTIAQFQFDTGKAFAGLGIKPDSCGCVEQPQRIVVIEASWLGADGVVDPFWVTYQCLAWEDPNDSVFCPFSGCELCGPDAPPPPHNPCANQQPTAAATKSWGSVKALYR